MNNQQPCYVEAKTCDLSSLSYGDNVSFGFNVKIKSDTGK